MNRTKRRSPLFALLAILLVQGSAAAQSLTIRVNLPAYRLDVYQGSERIRSYRTAIGSRSHPTPTGGFEVQYVEWNPWWNPPNGPWAQGAKRTPPGPNNPMGRAKIQFIPLYYIHGSSAPLGRAASHGCVRISNEDALDLAKLLALETGARIGPSEISALERNSGRTRQVGVPARVRVEIVYILAEEIDGEVHVYEDVYGLGMTETERALSRRVR